MNHSVRFERTLREPQCYIAGALRHAQDKLQAADKAPENNTLGYLKKQYKFYSFLGKFILILTYANRKRNQIRL